MSIYVLIVALTVSIDSFFCGLSLTKNKKITLEVIKIISVVLLMCLFANFLGVYFSNLFSLNYEIFGGAIFILIAILELCSKQQDFSTPLCLGFAIGLDGSCANFSLAIMGYNSIFTPIILTLFHLIFLVLGVLVTKIKFFKKISENKFVAPIILSLLGLYKIVFAFI